MIEVDVEKDNVVTKFTINGNIVNIYDKNKKLIRTVITENENEKMILRNIIYTNYDSYINVINID